MEVYGKIPGPKDVEEMVRRIMLKVEAWIDISEYDAEIKEDLTEYLINYFHLDC